MQVGIQSYQFSTAAELVEFCQLTQAECVEMELDGEGRDPDKAHTMSGHFDLPVTELVGRLRDNGIEVMDFCLHGKLTVTADATLRSSASLRSTSESRRRQRFGFFFGAIDKAQELGVPLIHTYPSVDQDLPQDEAWDLTVAAYREAVAYASPKGVRICSQAINYPLDTCEHFRQLWDEVGSDDLGINVDFANHYIRGEDTLDLIPKFGKRIFMCHAKDVDLPNPDWAGVRLPGLGGVDIVGCVQALMDAGVDVPLIIEHESPHFDQSQHFSAKPVGVAFGVGYMKAVVAALGA